MGIKVANNAFATLASSITNSATSITLTTGQGARFPSLGAGDYFYATLVDTSNNLEIVKCTARSTDVLTVVRAQESTTARAYSAGDRIEIRLTAATFTDATQALPTQTGNAGKYLKTDGTNATWETVSVTPTAISDQANSSTGYLDLPSGTTAQRPGSPNAGMVRFNTTTGEPEWYDPGGSGQWLGFSKGPNYVVEFLVVAGGGAGSSHYAGNYEGGGGGAGGYIASSLTIASLTNYTITVGAGGASAAGLGSNSGSNSAGLGQTAIGGGKGGAGTQSGSSGGSGGGSGWISNAARDAGTGGGSGTAGQGNAGGPAGGSLNGGGGGGGAGAAGQAGALGGNGGNGSTWLNGVTYAGGGSGSRHGSGSTEGGGVAGTGGGGTGSPASASNTATSGTANTGGGGGGNWESSASTPAGNGGSGVVIIRYAGSQRATGGTVTTTGGYTYHTFTTSGTFTS